MERNLSNFVKPPTLKKREWQWAEQFKINDGNWFCLVIESRSGEFIGFAKTQKYNYSDLPMFNGELNKIYLLKGYQRKGLGKKFLKKWLKGC